MYCMNCGKENPDDVKFCCFCGTPANSVSRSIDKISENLAENGQLEIEDAADITSAISEKIDEKTAENAVENTAASQIPIPPVIPTAPTSSTAPISRVAPADLVSNVSPVRNPMPSRPYGYPRNPYAQPQPINTQGASPTLKAVQNVQNVNSPTKTNIPNKKQDVVRSFTLKHIIMCLISTAVCAIAAGIFAGLYFSVI